MTDPLTPREREALYRLKELGAAYPAELRPASRATVAALLAKGWARRLARRPHDLTRLGITPAGLEALSASPADTSGQA